ncbi:MAG: hypothetical protein ACRDRA_06420 [Pseudonocardiaceae bacterium]
MTAAATKPPFADASPAEIRAALYTYKDIPADEALPVKGPADTKFVVAATEVLNECVPGTD